MSLRAQLRPGTGLLLLVATLIAASAFFAWGLRTPLLERVWQIQLELQLGRRKPLSIEEREVMQRALTEHPSLAEAFLDEQPIGIISANRDGLIENGYAYLVRAKPSGRQTLELVATDVRGQKPLEVTVRLGGKAEQNGSVSAGAPFRLELPNEGKFPQLIEVLVARPQKKPGQGRDRHAIVVRMTERP